MGCRHTPGTPEGDNQGGGRGGITMAAPNSPSPYPYLSPAHYLTSPFFTSVHLYLTPLLPRPLPQPLPLTPAPPPYLSPSPLPKPLLLTSAPPLTSAPSCLAIWTYLSILFFCEGSTMAPMSIPYVHGWEVQPTN